MRVQLVEERLQYPERERERYRRLGALIVEPGHVAYFSRRDFRPDSFLALLDRRCEIALITAVHPGRGAFGRLAEALLTRGYRVAVVMPLGGFKDHLRRAGWEPGCDWRGVFTMERSP